MRPPCSTSAPNLLLEALRAHGAGVAVAVAGGPEPVDAHPRAGVGRVDEAAVARVQAHVAEAVEEHDVTGPEVAAGDVVPEAPLRVAGVRDLHAGGSPGEHRQAGAV